MNKTGIEWTDFTWNPVTGCKHDCRYCYARDLAETRLKHIYLNGFEPTFWEERLDQPLKRKKPAKIFTVSMGDLFGEWVSSEWIEKILGVIRQAPQHTFQLLTKNPTKYYRFKFPKNAWLGASADNIIDANLRSQHLGIISTNPTFLSLEPLLEDVADHIDYSGIDWIIIGAQTGKVRKPVDPAWVYKIIEYARMHDIPIFIKNNVKTISVSDRFQEFPNVK